MDHSDRLARLVLVDTGLSGRVLPAPGVMLALIRHMARPSERSALRLFRNVSFDFERLRQRMGDRWEAFPAYSVDRSRTPSVQQANRRLLREIGFPAIPPEDLARIGVPTSLIWGRHDRVMPLRTAEEASARYGWPLHVLEGRRPHLARRPTTTVPGGASRRARRWLTLRRGAGLSDAYRRSYVVASKLCPREVQGKNRQTVTIDVTEV